MTRHRYGLVSLLCPCGDPAEFVDLWCGNECSTRHSTPLATLRARVEAQAAALRQARDDLDTAESELRDLRRVVSEVVVPALETAMDEFRRLRLAWDRRDSRSQHAIELACQMRDALTALLDSLVGTS